MVANDILSERLVSIIGGIFMIRILLILLLLAGITTGGWYSWDKIAFVRELVEDKFSIKEFQTLELRYTAEQIIENHRSELLKDRNYSLLEPQLEFHPYLLMEVKYTKANHLTGEGILLWGLRDGEMVLDTHTWERTHGFEDCLIAKANKNDFKIINALVIAQGSLDRERLYHKFKVDSEVLDEWVESCRKKKLIAITGSKVRLHFQNPKLENEPVTKVGQSIVEHPSKAARKITAHYSAGQIKKLTEVVFGKDFGIRKSKEVYLPVFSIAVQNPDGSTRTTYWNALNGERL